MGLSNYLEERDAAVLAGGAAFHAFCLKYDKVASRPEVEEIALHKMRTGIASMPEDVKQASRRWLKDRGYMPYS